MIIGPQIQITDAMITATNISTAGEPAAYDAATTYALGDQVTYEFNVYESLQNSNTGNTPPRTSDLDANVNEYWVRIGAINKFKPFEHDIRRARLYDQCANSETITYTIRPDTQVDMIGFFNLDAISLQVVMTSDEDGEVYNETFDLADNSEVVDFWTHRFAPLTFDTEKVFFNLPIYLDAEIDITIINTGGTAKVGQIALARQRDLGITLIGTELSTRTISTMEQDVNGQFTSYVNRGSIRIIDYNLAANTASARRLQRIFQREVEAMPCIFTAGENTEKYGTTMFGYGKEFRLPTGATVSYATIISEQFR